VLLSTRGGVLSAIAVRLVRLVRSGGPGFVPFLFPGFMSASEATDLAPHELDIKWLATNLQLPHGQFAKQPALKALATPRLSIAALAGELSADDALVAVRGFGARLQRPLRKRC